MEARLAAAAAAIVGLLGDSLEGLGIGLHICKLSRLGVARHIPFVLGILHLSPVVDGSFAKTFSCISGHVLSPPLSSGDHRSRAFIRKDFVEQRVPFRAVYYMRTPDSPTNQMCDRGDLWQHSGRDHFIANKPLRFVDAHS